jgi:uncharacterized protein YjbJ (UPF0337 family)
MSDHNKDRIEGGVDQVKGTVKEKAGDVTGNEQAQAEGMFDKLKGKAKEGLADAKDKIDDLTDGDRNKSSR